MTAFLDTNVLIYAQGGEDKGEVARQTILAGGVISVQVLNEFAAVLRRKFGFEWDVIADAVADVRAALDPVRPIDVATHVEALSIARLHGFSLYDSLIVASALEAGCDRLLTGGSSGRSAHWRPGSRQSIRVNGVEDTAP